jgi:hypothetical protein
VQEKVSRCIKLNPKLLIQIPHLAVNNGKPDQNPASGSKAIFALAKHVQLPLDVFQHVMKHDQVKAASQLVQWKSSYPQSGNHLVVGSQEGIDPCQAAKSGAVEDAEELATTAADVENP